MSLVYICNNCESKYEAEIGTRSIVYQVGNKRVELLSENDDCEECRKEIEANLEKARTEARLKIKERNHHDSQKNI